MQNNPKIFIVAGEASGDDNGAALINSISELNNNISYYGIGGSKFKEKNVEIIYDYSDVNYIGFSNVIKNIKVIKRILNETVEYVKKLNPDIIILIDFPGFNLKFAELVKKFYKGKIIYYISPQIWAWHKSRIKKIKKFVDKMLVIFPFEVEFYKKLNFNVDYVGHPMIKKIDAFLKDNKKTESDGLNICLLPGSRLEEVQRIFPTLAGVAEVIRRKYSAEISLIYPENISQHYYRSVLKGRQCNLVLNNENNHYKTLFNSDLVLTKFGTTTLELSLLKIPFISVYKAGVFNYTIAKTLASIEYVSMPNILAGKEIVKEFIQSEMTAEKIFAEARKIITENDYRKEMINNFIEMRKIFDEYPVKKPAAEIILDALSNNN
jgi:lipid-A-disaccharide synthase